MYFKTEHSPPPACYPWRLYASMVTMETVDKLQMFFTAVDKSHLHDFSTPVPCTTSVGSQTPGHHSSPIGCDPAAAGGEQGQPTQPSHPLKKKKKHPKKQNKQKTTKNNKAKQKTPKLMHICSFTFLQSVATYYLSELPTFVFEICDKHLFPSQMFSTDHGQILLNHTSSSINNFNNR